MVLYHVYKDCCFAFESFFRIRCGEGYGHFTALPIGEMTTVWTQ